MCGISFFCCFAHECTIRHGCPLENRQITNNSFLKHRGPDVGGHVSEQLWKNVKGFFSGYVLHLRGCLTQQPVVNMQGDIMLWNGEIFDGLKVDENLNDTQVLFDKLTRCITDAEMCAVIQAIQGPWSLIFWQNKQQKLWFGRDVFGRRSLLWHLPKGEDCCFSLSSVTVSDFKFEEVPAVGLFYLSVDPKVAACHEILPIELNIFPWQRAVWPGTASSVADSSSPLNVNSHMTVKIHSEEAIPSWMPVLNKLYPDEGRHFDYLATATNTAGLEILKEVRSLNKDMVILANQLLDVLEKAVKKRVFNLPRPNGEKSVQCKTNINDDSPITFDSENTAIKEQKDKASDSIHFSSYSHELSESEKMTVPQPVVDASSAQYDNTDIVYLSDDQSASVDPLLTSVRSSLIYGEASNISKSQLQLKEPFPAYVAVLFSGGVDSAVLAALADRCVPANESIDLINVAFEQKPVIPSNKVANSQKNYGQGFFSVPDRHTGYLALSELNSCRQWNFVEVNITQEDLQKCRSDRIRHLLHPHNTVLDDSIGCALWFAARGTGILGAGPCKGQSYTSKAKVILCGMGADEQLAGYSRHRVCFNRSSWAGLNNELEMEINRISTRNLGRDDRIIADHGKESRFPYLDEQVVAFLAALPIYHKVDLRLTRGVGEKLLLRLAAYQLELFLTASFPKRAIQFGSRIAKMEQKKEKGSQICHRLFSTCD